jgi:putative transposase
VLANKAFRFRIYPTPAQVALLNEWESALRWVWNHWVDQRRQALRAGKYFSAFDQTYELPALKRVYPWLAAPPARAYLALAKRLDLAWQACFAKRAKPPRFKKKGCDAVSIAWDQIPESVIAPDQQGRQQLRFAKLGDVRVVRHRPLQGTPKTATITRERDAWYVVITCEVAAVAPHDGPIVGIDRGITETLVDSEGRVAAAPKFLGSRLRQLRRLQRRVARRAVRNQPDSHRCKRARAAVAKLHAHVARQRSAWLHQQSRHYADTAGHVVLEDLNIAGMVRGHCARSILEQGWATFSNQLTQKMAAGHVVKVPAHYTSQTCGACGVVDARSRKGKTFCCVACGHRDDADANAALEIQRRGIKILAEQSAEPTACATRDGARQRRIARSTGASRQKLVRCARRSDAPLADGLLTAKCSSEHNPRGNSGASINIVPSQPTRCSQTEAQASGRPTLLSDLSEGLARC